MNATPSQNLEFIPGSNYFERESHNTTHVETKNIRISRACDECRKRKTKCISEGQVCQLCSSRHKDCTFDLPSFKRGPKPKDTITYQGEAQFKLSPTLSVNTLETTSIPSPPLSSSPARLESCAFPPVDSPVIISPITPTPTTFDFNCTGKHMYNYLQFMLQNNTISSLSPFESNLILDYFYHLHDQNSVIELTRFFNYIVLPKCPMSFQLLLNCLYISTTRSLPHLNHLYQSFYSQQHFRQETFNLNALLVAQMEEDPLDVSLNRQIGYTLLNYPYNNYPSN